MSKIPAQSERARFARAVSMLLRTREGEILAKYLEEIATSLSCFGPDGQMYDDRRIMFQEGQRQLAIQLLGTITDAKNIEGE